MLIFFLLSGLDIPTLADVADIANVPSGKIMLPSMNYIGRCTEGCNSLVLKGHVSCLWTIFKPKGTQFSYEELETAIHPVIGDGAFGTVYLGHNIRHSATSVAIKVLNEVCQCMCSLTCTCNEYICHL